MEKRKKGLVRSWTRYLHWIGAILSFLAVIPGGLWYNPSNTFPIVVGTLILLELVPAAKVKIDKNVLSAIIGGIKRGLLIKEMFTVAAAIATVGWAIEGNIGAAVSMGILTVGLFLSDIGTEVEKKEIKRGA